jgi:hypothetical protein
MSTALLAGPPNKYTNQTNKSNKSNADELFADIGNAIFDVDRNRNLGVEFDALFVTRLAVSRQPSAVLTPKLRV